MRHDIALGLVVLGTAVTVLAGVGALAVRRDVLLRLHFVTPITSLAAPLVGIGVCIDSGQPWVIAEVMVIVLMLFLAGPVLGPATARAAGQRRGLLTEEQPE